MKALIAIESCHAHAGLNQEIRSTWLMNRTVDYRFFMGASLNGSPMGGSPRMHDEIWLNVDDGYAALPLKTQAIMGWALEKGYTNVFKCDTDTYVCVPRLLKSGFEAHHYVGCFATCKSCKPLASGHCQCMSDDGKERYYSYASGGAGYWLSEHAMRIVLESRFILDPLIPTRDEPSTRGEDLQVGWALGRAGILCHRDTRYSLWWPGPLPDNNVITLHDVTRLARSSERMRTIHQAWLNRGGER